LNSITLPENPKNLFIDISGTLFVAVDRGLICKIDAYSEVSVVAELPECFGLTADKEGTLYVSSRYSLFKLPEVAAKYEPTLNKDLRRLSEHSSDYSIGSKFTITLNTMIIPLFREIASVRCPSIISL